MVLEDRSPSLSIAEANQQLGATSLFHSRVSYSDAKGVINGAVLPVLWVLRVLIVLRRARSRGVERGRAKS